MHPFQSDLTSFLHHSAAGTGLLLGFFIGYKLVFDYDLTWE